ncbi:magnesium transporter [Aerococcaceae bacterium DSM 111022]|nr:magnesium transporter [Aerococcaceae bacterium DSM 111022]
MEIFDRTIEEHTKKIEKFLHENRMAQFRTEFLALHNYDQAQVFHGIDEEARFKLYQYLSPSELADIFDMLESQDERVDIYFEEMENLYGASVLAAMYPDNAVDVLNDLKDKHQVQIYMQLMPAENAREISILMNYLEDTAGAIMTPEFISIQRDLTLGEAYTELRKKASEAETIYYVYVVDDHNRLSGVISLRDLIINDENKRVADVMNTHTISVGVNDDQEEVAKMVQDYDLLALPVIGFKQELLGIITVDDVLDVMKEEHESDYSGFAAVDVSESHETPISASKSRLPWLITLLFLGLGTSTLISQYDQLIESASILSAFVTLITGTAGNAGTQSLAVAVRKLTNKKEDDSLFKSFMFEVLTGIFTGLIVGIAVVIIVFVWKRNLILGFVIGIAMMMAITVANLAGALIPKLMERLGFDPAVASGPFITTLSDLTSVFIYFSVAQMFMGYLI